ncbi:hypothetical protein RND81_02G130400 [Saponaria officinalis]|uniref:Bifunctional inhibitor/plant lipid transfer protein/seed storage helical domain-containing protein n=1 Tax=Saponaria officinalis TaxID=3572 RepID=A0AAW1MTT9_SAPOF
MTLSETRIYFIFFILISNLMLNLSQMSNSTIIQQIAIKCEDVITDLSSCSDFIKDESDLPDPDCCQGVHNVADVANSHSLLQEICES